MERDCERRWYNSDKPITRDDVCVEQACDTEKRKASFHVKVPRLVFRNMACDMKSFVFYFCAWMGENIDDVSEKIPQIFFYQTPDAQEKIKIPRRGSGRVLETNQGGV